MKLVVVDTDVLAIHHVFTWDQRYEINAAFLRRLENPATTIHNILELAGIICRARRTQYAARIYRSYMLSRRWTILFQGRLWTGASTVAECTGTWRRV